MSRVAIPESLAASLTGRAGVSVWRLVVTVWRFWLLGGLGAAPSACQDATIIVGKLPASPDNAKRVAADSGKPDAASSAEMLDAGGDTSATPTGPRVDDAQFALEIEPGTRSDFCQRAGTALAAMPLTAAASDCAARVERRVFSYALCACEQLTTEGESFSIDSFDSADGPYRVAQTGAAVGVGSPQLQVAKTTQLLGNLLIAGGGALEVGAQDLLVSGDLKLDAMLVLRGDKLRVGRDLWVASDVMLAQGSLQVGRDAYQPRGFAGLEGASIAGNTYVASEFRVPTPCACDDRAPVDVAALVTAARQRNDDTEAGFEPSSLNIDSYVTDIKQLPCGRLYAAGITLQSTGTYLVVSAGRSALFVEGDLTVHTVSTLSLAPGAMGELDLYVSGNVNVEASATLSLGDQARPSAMRVYVAGEIDAQGTIVLGAQLYAPHATFSVAAEKADVELYGAIFAKNIQLATQRFHYDRAILRSGGRCTAAAPQRCASGSECPDDLACIAGSCAACITDADCYEPTVCTGGKCQALVTNWP